MVTMAQAMVKAGILKVDDVEDAMKKENDARQVYDDLSLSISALIREKRPLQDLQDLASLVGKKKYNPDAFFSRAKRYIEITKLNLEHKANQDMMQRMLQEKIDVLETKLKPMLAKSRKLESKWGFMRPGRNMSY